MIYYLLFELTGAFAFYPFIYHDRSLPSVYFDRDDRKTPVRFNACRSMTPPAHAQASSPIPVVNAKYHSAPSKPYAYLSTSGTAMTFAATYGSGARYGFDLSARTPSIPARDASVPNKMSHITPPVKRLASKQPRVTPGTAAGISTPNMQSASEIRNCIIPLESPNDAEMNVMMTYVAAIAAPRQPSRSTLPVFLFIFKIPCMYRSITCSAAHTARRLLRISPQKLFLSALVLFYVRKLTNSQLFFKLGILIQDQSSRLRLIMRQSFSVAAAASRGSAPSAEYFARSKVAVIAASSSSEAMLRLFSLR